MHYADGAIASPARPRPSSYRFVLPCRGPRLHRTRSPTPRHALSLQKHFLDGLARVGLAELPAAALVPPAAVARGNFLAFDVDDAEERHRRIAAQHVVIDRRGRRLRFGFGIYHSEHDVRLLLEALARAH